MAAQPDVACVAAPKAQPPSSTAADGATHVFVATSHTNPPAQSVEDAHDVRHAPNAGSHAYGPHSNTTASSSGHVAPIAVHTADPTPREVPTHRAGAHCEPFCAPM